MSVRVEQADGDARDRWNDYLRRSGQGTPFHQLEGVRTLAEHTGTDVHLLVGFVGEEPVGLFPVNEATWGAFSAVFSPPPNVRIPVQGPILLDSDGPKQRKVEQRHRAFIDGCHEWIEERISPRYTHFRTTTRYPDLRPFQWNGFDVTPEYTYVVDIAREEEELLASFSRDARSNIRSAESENCTIGVEDGAAIDWIIDQVSQRFAAQNISYHVTPEFVRGLHEALPSGQVRPYVCHLNGERMSGIITVEYGDVTYRWQGGIRKDCDVPVNDLLDWHIMQDARDRGIRRYDLVGAKTPSLCAYKAKFNPRLVSYYALERGTRLASLVSDVYKRLR